jgi:hypothetical protein
MTLAFRPHHFLCTLGFQGKGYSPEFIENYKEILKILTINENTAIKVVPQKDTICGPCPHLKHTKCDKEEKIQELDRHHLQILGIKVDQILTWHEAKKRIKEHMTLRAFHQACQSCSWKSLGFCEHALRELRGEANCDSKTAP